MAGMVPGSGGSTLHCQIYRQCFLGFGLDLTIVAPLLTPTVSESIKRALQLIEVNPHAPVRIITIDGVEYKVPDGVSVDKDAKLPQGAFITYSTGQAASIALITDANLSARYMAFPGNASVAYAITKAFRVDNQYALYAFNAARYSASFTNYLDLLNATGLRRRLANLPMPFTSDEAAVRAYKTFFNSVGTHVVINATYGARFQMFIFAPNDDAEINKKFSADVAAALNGIPTGGKFDASVMKEDQYKRFLGRFQKILSVVGGDLTLALELLNNPTYPYYTAWTATANQNLDAIQFVLMEIWTVMKETSDPFLVNAAQSLQDAFTYIVSQG